MSAVRASFVKTLKARLENMEARNNQLISDRAVAIAAFMLLREKLGAIAGPEDKFECIPDGPERDEIVTAYAETSHLPEIFK